MADLFCGIVAGAIDFNGKSCGRAIEVENVGADGMLSAEAKAGQTSAAESLPEENFGQGHFRAQRARSFKGYDRPAHLPLRRAARGTSPAVRGRILGENPFSGNFPPPYLALSDRLSGDPAKLSTSGGTLIFITV